MGRGGGGWSLSAFRWSVVLDCFQWSCWPDSWPACPTPARWIPQKNRWFGLHSWCKTALLLTVAYDHPQQKVPGIRALRKVPWVAWQVERALVGRSKYPLDPVIGSWETKMKKNLWFIDGWLHLKRIASWYYVGDGIQDWWATWRSWNCQSYSWKLKGEITTNMFFWTPYPAWSLKINVFPLKMDGWKMIKFVHFFLGG